MDVLFAVEPEDRKVPGQLLQRLVLTNKEQWERYLIFQEYKAYILYKLLQNKENAKEAATIPEVREFIENGGKYVPYESINPLKAKMYSCETHDTLLKCARLVNQAVKDTGKKYLKLDFTCDVKNIFYISLGEKRMSELMLKLPRRQIRESPTLERKLDYRTFEVITSVTRNKRNMDGRVGAQAGRTHHTNGKMKMKNSSGKLKEEAIERRIAECVKDEAFQQELKREVEKARMEARTNMHKEVEAEKVLIQKSFDEKLKAPKKTGDEHTSTKELPPTVAVVKESEAEALRKEKKLESLRKIAEEREKYRFTNANWRVTYTYRVGSDYWPS
ncbi:hypothetical protein Pmar_PMAR015911 [Perkinsus marinus ATCC 50983]|uniref:Uncharacterized protein n=1 Tax=Perkinsus marinus (strain ATCC 50983 / TXsc) TaxID=423536 RepID=C5L426_PERM5|nr:hypothetical protein Pmar_PMAR015911 [Perkinsus marinus ATCC 50983]EER08492.1 hypothetical protein Pmar_PMAR015911 [Perkinsus marinus ATCC 50983]|eukprot:XP_002776676.1 hypothetical protein Pmar_PMAR015911 [Perkinsus marinus ATCC 50983]